MDRKISRRDILAAAAGTPVVRMLGCGGLLTLLADRQAVAAGSVIQIHGVTTEAGRGGGVAHVHPFTGQFKVLAINPNTGVISGEITGRTIQTIVTGFSDPPKHKHDIWLPGVIIGASGNTGVAANHVHSVRVD